MRCSGGQDIRQSDLAHSCLLPASDPVVINPGLSENRTYPFAKLIRVSSDSANYRAEEPPLSRHTSRTRRERNLASEQRLPWPGEPSINWRPRECSWTQGRYPLTNALCGLSSRYGLLASATSHAADRNLSPPPSRSQLCHLLHWGGFAAQRGRCMQPQLYVPAAGKLQRLPFIGGQYTGEP